MINDTPLLLWYHMAQAGPPVGEEGLMLDYLINHRIPPTTIVQDTHCTALTWYYEGGYESFGVRFEFRDSSLQVCVYYASTILPVTLWQIKTSHLLWQV